MTIKYNIGGIGMDVNRKLSKGESIPVTMPITGPAKKPAYLLQNRNGQSCKKNSPVLQL